MKLSKTIIAAIIVLLGSSSIGQEAPEVMSGTIMELMVITVTPASDILWGADDPQSAEEWATLDDAAVALIDAFEKARDGGAGPSDDGWAADSRFQAYLDEEVVAAEAAREAIATRDIDALFVAGDALYSPCENCHIDFNPAVLGD